MFTELAGLIPTKGSINMTLTALGDGRISVAVRPIVPEGKAKAEAIRPLVMKGTPEDFEREFLGALTSYQPAVAQFVSNLADAEKSLADAAAKAKERTAKGSACTPAKVEKGPGRAEAPLSEEDLRAIGSIPSGDLNFKSALGRASLETLKAAYTVRMNKGSTSAAKVIAAEIKKVSGKTVEELGLVPRQANLMGLLGDIPLAPAATTASPATSAQVEADSAPQAGTTQMPLTAGEFLTDPEDEFEAALEGQD